MGLTSRQGFRAQEDSLVWDGGQSSWRVCPGSPVPVQEGLLRHWSAGLVEPLQAAPALQHLQVPPEVNGTSDPPRHTLITAPDPAHHSPAPFSTPTTLPFSFVPTPITCSLAPSPSLLTPQGHHSNSSSAG